MLNIFINLKLLVRKQLQSRYCDLTERILQYSLLDILTRWILYVSFGSQNDLTFNVNLQKRIFPVILSI